MTKKIIIPLPNHDFDPTEVAIPWKLMCDAGFAVFFATPTGQVAKCDPMMITGEGLDPWGWIPFLNKIKLIGLLLRADKQARDAYQALKQDQHFQAPLKYADLSIENFDGMLLPGGHAPKMRPYLEDKILQEFVADFFESTDQHNEHKPIAAICHGVLLAARSISKTTERSALYGKKTTALPWDFENSAWKLTKYLARFWDSNYYRTYQETANEPKGYWSVENEIKRALENEADFINVPKDTSHFKLKTSGLARDKVSNAHPAWVVQDGNYLSARWPGDAHTLASSFINTLNKTKVSV